MTNQPKLYSLLILLLFSFWATDAAAQAYAPFPDSVAAWTNQLTLFDPNGNQVTNHYYCLEGDTTISGKVYHPLFFNNVLCGAVREDSSKKVFFAPLGTPAAIWCPIPTDSVEYLLYDFGRAVGDTFYTENGVGPVVNVVEVIDTVLIGGQMRREFVLSKGYSPSELWYQDRQIEGMGSRNDVLFPFCTPFEEGHVLLCFKDPTLNVGNCAQVGCQLVGIEETVDAGASVTVVPHPVEETSKMVLGSGWTQQAEVSIFDLQGRVIWKKTMQGETVVPIGKLGLERGIYLYRVAQDDNEKHGKILVK